MKKKIKPICLDYESYNKIKTQNIIFCGKSVKYLIELSEKYPELICKVLFILDEYPKNWGWFNFNGRSIQVYGFEHLRQEKLQNVAIVITSDYWWEIYEKLVKMILNKVNQIYYFLDFESLYDLSYRKHYNNHPLKNYIIFRSGPHSDSFISGMDFADNSRALFEHMLQHGYNRKYKLIWFVKNPLDYFAYAHVPNVYFMSYDWAVSERKEERDQYYKALCLAKFIFFTDAYGFARNCRKDQVRIQLWHGCGYKTRVNFVSCERRYEYTTVVSSLYADIHKKLFGLRENQILVTGYPKQDWLFTRNEKYFDVLNIPKARKYIMWLPTFRSVEEKLGHLNQYKLNSVSGLPVLCKKDMMDELNNILIEKDIVMLVKLHPFQNIRDVNCGKYSNLMLIQNNDLINYDIQINQLLGMVDALISDYSSVAVDYLLLDRPMAFTVDDMEEYKNSRGFIFENIEEWLPGSIVKGFNDLVEFVNCISDGIDKTEDIRRKLKNKMLTFKDKGNCQRVIDSLGI